MTESTRPEECKYCGVSPLEAWEEADRTCDDCHGERNYQPHGGIIS